MAVPALHLDTTQSAPARVASLDPPTLSISTALSGAAEPAITVALAGAFVRLRPEFAPIDIMSAWDYLAFYEAAVEPLSDAPATLDDELRSRIRDWHDRFGDDADTDTRLEGADVPGVGAFRDHVEAVATRAAAVLAGDPAATFFSVLDQQYESAPASVDGLRAVCARIPAARALVTWLLDGGYARARAALESGASH